MRLWTDSLDDHGYFDPRYTCDMDNSSPELRWDDVPSEIRSFALIVEDPDAGGPTPFSHWVVSHIPADIRHLPAGVPPQEILPNGIRQGVNSFGKLGYGGPCPPISHGAHRYFFRLFALRGVPEIASRPNREQLLAAIAPLQIGETRLMGMYKRAMSRAG